MRHPLLERLDDAFGEVIGVMGIEALNKGSYPFK